MPPSRQAALAAAYYAQHLAETDNGHCALAKDPPLSPGFEVTDDWVSVMKAVHVGGLSCMPCLACYRNLAV